MKTEQIVIYAIILFLLYKLLTQNKEPFAGGCGLKEMFTGGCGLKEMFQLNSLPSCSKFMTSKMACDEASKYSCKWNDQPHDNPIENCLCTDSSKCSGSGIVSGPMADLKKKIQEKMNEYNALKEELDLLDIKPPEKMAKLKQLAGEYEVLRNQAM